MAIPNVQAILMPLLRSCANGPRPIAEVEEHVANHFGLTAEERSLTRHSGRRLFHTRFRNARGYLRDYGLVSTENWGVLEATQAGRRLIDTGVPEITFEMLVRAPGFITTNGGSPSSSDSLLEIGSVGDGEPMIEEPETRIDRAVAVLDDDIREELLTRLRSVSPQFFERVVVDIMLAMGYGGTHRDAGRRLGRSGDGGVDGVISEDRLGLDRIYLQAKRNAADNVVGRPIIQAFVGALHGQSAHKGVFITTSSFSREASDYANSLGNMRVILIDGATLSGLMIDHDVGVRIQRTVALKRIDLDYFEDGEV